MIEEKLTKAEVAKIRAKGGGVEMEHDDGNQYGNATGNLLLGETHGNPNI